LGVAARRSRRGYVRDILKKLQYYCIA